MRLTVLATAVLLPTQINAAPNVVTDIPVVHSLASMVMGDLAAPDLLLDRSADPHSFQLRPSQARQLADAELIVWVGPELTPWLGRAIESLPDMAESLALLAAPGLDLHIYSEDHDHGHEDEHGHEHGHEDDHGHEADHHEHEGAVDPHAWLSPQNAAIWVREIAEKLSTLDPDNAETYAANANKALVTIEAARAEALALLSEASPAPIVVFHDAYGYFSEAFGITVAGSIALGDAAAPGARRLGELRETAEANGVQCVFREPAHSPSLAASLADELGLSLGELDPTGIAQTPGPDLYPELLRAMATEIATCADPKS